MSDTGPQALPTTESGLLDELRSLWDEQLREADEQRWDVTVLFATLAGPQKVQGKVRKRHPGGLYQLQCATAEEKQPVGAVPVVGDVDTQLIWIAVEQIAVLVVHEGRYKAKVQA